jgi:spermidine/putrescine transport system substrate-binding protein
MMRTLLLATAMTLTGAAAYAEGELQLYNWGNYTSPELLAKFEAETGIKVTVTDYASNDEALAKIEAGGSGYDLVVPSNSFIPIYLDKGLIAPLDLARLPNHKNIAPEWMDVSWDPGRVSSVPWQWGSTGVGVNTSVYGGDINTASIFLEPPTELIGKINVTPEMNDVIGTATLYLGGELCTEDTEMLKKVRDLLMAAKPSWMSMDYGMEDKMATNDVPASMYWNGAIMRARLKNPDVQFGYPKEGYLLFMDSVALLSDAKNVDEAYLFLDFIMAPENAAMLSAFARYGNGIAGSDAFMPDDMKTAPEVIIPAEYKALGQFLPTCSPKANEYNTAIWTELMK